MNKDTISDHLEKDDLFLAVEKVCELLGITIKPIDFLRLEIKYADRTNALDYTHDLYIITRNHQRVTSLSYSKYKEIDYCAAYKDIFNEKTTKG